ncbi:hypothetical protein E2C01_081388 [Portunus trituberculatus]|uniref:Uncharacterized protein n=1 Tax=Portunus trituberculatus TaxID=210409 RepID=A0A5B7IYN5_PORTR|nr:hypothetical protein [Portunus trituberculatus]
MCHHCETYGQALLVAARILPRCCYPGRRREIDKFSTGGRQSEGRQGASRHGTWRQWRSRSRGGRERKRDEGCLTVKRKRFL